MLRLSLFSAALLAVTNGSAFSAPAPATECDIYAASSLDPERKAAGVPVDKLNPDLAIPACEMAAQTYPNSNRIAFQLGRSYSKKNNFGDAFLQFKKAATNGHALAQYNLGVMYERAMGVKEDKAQAVSWYRKAAEQGYAIAQFNLGNMIRLGQGVRSDPAEGLKWLQKAAEQGNARASLIVGLMYGAGQGTPKDYTKSAKWFSAAANQGDAEAQRLLGVMYEFGDGVPRDREEAADWYRKAANQGDTEAVAKLAAIDADANASRVAREVGDAALHKALAEGSTKEKAWAEAAQAASVAAMDVELAAGRDQDVAKRAAKQVAQQVRDQSSKAQGAETVIDEEQRISGSKSASKTFVVAIEASVSGGARPIITGTTNLPDGTQLVMWLAQPWLPDAKERLAAGRTACGNDSCAPLQTYSKLPNGVGNGVVVQNGHFTDGPFTYEGSPLRPGNYVLEILVYSSILQPEDVRSVIGQHGENMAGRLVNGCCFGHHMTPAEIQDELDKLRRGTPITGAMLYYARNVVVGLSAEAGD
jgi:TPR repeat protein